MASFLVQRSGVGASVFDLLDGIRAKAAQQPQLIVRVTRRVHETLGNTWQSAKDVRFDLEAAVESIRYFDGAQIPKVSLPLPEGVSQVNFAANLERVPPLTAKTLPGSGTLFRSLARAR